MTNWMSGVCEANGININYLRTGGSKPPLDAGHGLVYDQPERFADVVRRFLLSVA
jgi:hypothetical protein